MVNDQWLMINDQWLMVNDPTLARGLAGLVSKRIFLYIGGRIASLVGGRIASHTPLVRGLCPYTCVTQRWY